MTPATQGKDDRVIAALDPEDEVVELAAGFGVEDPVEVVELEALPVATVPPLQRKRNKSDQSGDYRGADER